MSQRTRLSQFESGPKDLSEFKQKATEILENRRLKHLNFTMTAGTGEGQGGTGGTGGEPGGNTGGAGGEGTPSGDSGADPNAGKDPGVKIAALEEEKDRHFKARQEAETELQKYRDAEAERERASNDELTNLKNDLQKANDTLANTQAALDQALLDNAFLQENSYEWQNPSRVLQLVDRSTVQIKDGKVEGVKDALKALAESDAYLLKPAEGGQQQPGGGATGPGHNGKKTPPGPPSREDLARKYPALRR